MFVPCAVTVAYRQHGPRRGMTLGRRQEISRRKTPGRAPSLIRAGNCRTSPARSQDAVSAASSTARDPSRRLSRYPRAASALQNAQTRVALQEADKPLVEHDGDPTGDRIVVGPMEHPERGLFICPAEIVAGCRRRRSERQRRMCRGNCSAMARDAESATAEPRDAGQRERSTRYLRHHLFECRLHFLDRIEQFLTWIHEAKTPGRGMSFPPRSISGMPLDLTLPISAPP